MHCLIQRNIQTDDPKHSPEVPCTFSFSQTQNSHKNNDCFHVLIIPWQNYSLAFSLVICQLTFAVFLELDTHKRVKIGGRQKIEERVDMTVSDCEALFMENRVDKRTSLKAVFMRKASPLVSGNITHNCKKFKCLDCLCFCCVLLQIHHLGNIKKLKRSLKL